jgi:adenylate kinase
MSYLVEKMQGNATPRSLPVIVITGTPGTGKTTHAQLVVDQSPVPLQHINVSELVKEKMLHDGFDEEWQTYVVDEDKVCVLASSRSH